MEKKNINVPTHSITTLVFEDRCQNVLLAGFHDSGKNEFALLPLLAQDCMDRATGVIIAATENHLPKAAAEMAKSQGRPCLYFDPTDGNCPSFNPLAGPEDEVIEDMVEVFDDIFHNSPRFFKDLTRQVLRNALRVLKRLDKAEGTDGKYSTLAWLSILLNNPGGEGKELVQKFSRLPTSTREEARENADAANWFLNEYFGKFSKTFENSSGLRSQVKTLCSYRQVQGILNPDPEKGEINQLDFGKCIKNGTVVCISTAENQLATHSFILGRMLMTRLRSTVMRNSEVKLSIYITSALSLFFPSLLPLLEHRNTAVHLSMTNSGQLSFGLGNHAGKQFVERTIAGMRNVALFTGVSGGDARMYLDLLSAPDSISASDITYQPKGSALCRFVHNGTPMAPQFMDLRSRTFMDMSDTGHPAVSKES